jgi:hypothetical protein
MEVMETIPSRIAWKKKLRWRQGVIHTFLESFSSLFFPLNQDLYSLGILFGSTLDIDQQILYVGFQFPLGFGLCDRSRWCSSNPISI